MFNNKNCKILKHEKNWLWDYLKKKKNQKKLMVIKKNVINNYFF
jgi:hypothetical protein